MNSTPPAPPTNDDVLHVATHVLGAIRRAKTEAKVGMSAAVSNVDVRDTEAAVDGDRGDAPAICFSLAS